MEHLATADAPTGVFRSVVDGWFYGLEAEALAEGASDPMDGAGLAARTADLLAARLTGVSQTTPQFATALRAYHRTVHGGDAATADGLIAWLAGQPHVGAAAKKAAGLKWDLGHFAALSFLRGLLTVLRDFGFAGLVLVLDEVETLHGLVALGDSAFGSEGGGQDGRPRGEWVQAILCPAPVAVPIAARLQLAHRHGAELPGQPGDRPG